EGGLAERTGPKVDSDASKASTPLSPVGNEADGLVEIRALPQATALTALDVHPTLDLAVVNGLQQAVLFRPSTAQWLNAINIAEGDVSDLRFSRDGKLLMVAAGQAAVSGTVTAFDVETGKRIWQVADETDSILTFDLSPNGHLLAVGGPSKTVRIYEVPSGREMHALKKHTDWVLNVRFSPDGLLLASSDRFGGIFVWEPIQGAVFHGLKDHTGAAHAIAWDVDSETLISGGEDGKLRTWNMHHGLLTSCWDAQVGPILDLARSSGFTSAAGRSGKVVVWSNPETQVAHYEIGDQAETLVRTADSQHWIVGDNRGQLSILEATKLGLVATLSLPTDASAMQKLLVRLDEAEQSYATTLQSAAAQAAANSLPEKAKESVAVPQPATDDSVGMRDSTNSTNSSRRDSEFALELEVNRRQVAEVEELLQQSNRVLSRLAQHNEQLVELLTQSSEAQAELAQQISKQAQMLALLRARTRQLEEAAAMR
ncbi:MAG: hypothetical protein SFV81_05035, partial [Pirellulaceae bacterium]|nr:hypothetical protein [Pirellulaceae bacterium]